MSTSDDNGLADRDSVKLNEELIESIAQYHIDDEKVALLLENGADPFYVGKNGRSAYMDAARSGHVQWVGVFLEQGADVNQLIRGEASSVFLSCLQKCDLEFLKEMVERGADLDARDDNNKNAIFYAFFPDAHKLKKIKWLEAQGVDLDVADSNGHTPLSKACENRDLELGAYFISKNCNPDPVDRRNKLTPLVKAVKSGAIDIVAALLKAGADPDVKNLDGKTSYQVALEKGLVEIAKLINASAEQDFEKTGTKEKVEILQKKILSKLKDGARWSCSDREMSSALWYEAGDIHYYYRDNFCRENNADISEFFADDEAALAWLYDENKRAVGVNTMVGVYEKILQGIR